MTIPLLPLWDFVACYRVNFTFYLYLYLYLTTLFYKQAVYTVGV